MLRRILYEHVPKPKCVIIKDNCEIQGKNILFSIIKHHAQLELKVDVFLFENNPERVKKWFPPSTITIHDYTSVKEWANDKKPGDFLKVLESPRLSRIIIVDSLVAVINEYGFTETYRALHKLINSKELQLMQFATVLHEDVLESSERISKMLDKLATLQIRVLTLPDDNPKVEFVVEKSGGRLSKEVEEYFFEKNFFHTRLAKIPTLNEMMGKVEKETLPEDLATFKITLNEKDKKLRDNLILPYLKTAETEDIEDLGGNIVYNLDANDDWDEEDPDDDLNI